MGLNKGGRDALKKRWPTCFQDEDPGIFFVALVLDAMCWAKVPRSEGTSVTSFAREMQMEALSAYSVLRSKHVYFCLDLGAPPIKSIERKKNRDDKVEPLPFRDEPYLKLGKLVDFDWKRLRTNRKLCALEIGRFVLDSVYGHESFILPDGCHIHVQGGSDGKKVHRHVVTWKGSLEHAALEEGGTKRPTLRKQYFAKNDSLYNGIGEAELACLFFAEKHLHENVLFRLDDTDMIAILLLHCRNRLVKGKFKGRWWVHFRRRQYVDINSLYWNIVQDPLLTKYIDPVATVVAGLALCGCDYIHNFAHGIGGSHIFNELVSGRHPDMVKISAFRPATVTVDEVAFNRFTYCVYVSRYKKTVSLATLEEDIMDIAEKRKKKHLERCNKLLKMPEGGKREKEATLVLRAGKKLVQDTWRTTVFSRNLIFVLTYWSVSYIHPFPFVDPYMKVKGESFYGYEKIGGQACYCRVVDTLVFKEKVEDKGVILISLDSSEEEDE